MSKRKEQKNQLLYFSWNWCCKSSSRRRVVTGGAVVTGGVMEGIGKIFGNEGMSEGGRVLREGATQPLKDAREAVKMEKGRIDIENSLYYTT